MEHWFRPMGLTLKVSTQSSKLASAVCEAYGPLEVQDTESAPDLQFDFAECADRIAYPPEYRVSPERAELRMGDEVVLSVEPSLGVASGCFPSEFVDDRSSFRLHALHFALSAALSARGFLGLHAACIVVNGCAVLLRGPHGVGKSVLAYAARARGFRVIAGSTVWIAPADQTWGGIPRWIYLRHSARALFPEMPAVPEVLIGRERKVELDLGRAFADRAGPGIVVLMERNTAHAAQLDPVSKAEAFRVWPCGQAGNETTVPDYWTRIARLLDAPCYRLNCSDEIEDVLDLIAAAAQEHWQC
ncbi:MAG: hypothetical protein ABJF23_04210 [Bryobacteraceae bacterium]